MVLSSVCWVSHGKCQGQTLLASQYTATFTDQGVEFFWMEFDNILWFYKLKEHNSKSLETNASSV